MKRRIVCAALSMFMTLGFVARGDELSVSGRVTDSESGEPIEQATVTVTLGFGGSAEQREATTDEEGRYEIGAEYEGSGFGGGIILISAIADGYQEARDAAVVEDPSDGEQDTVSEQDFALVPQGDVEGDTVIISGEVTDGESGDPIEGAGVTATVGSQQSNQVGTTNTDEDGAYRIVILNTTGSSDVEIRAAAEGYENAQRTEEIANPADGVTDEVAADFALAAGQSQPASDSVYVLGTVIDQSSEEAIEGASVTVTLGFGGEQLEATTDENGEYVVGTVNTTGTRRVFGLAEADAYGEQRQDERIDEPEDGLTDSVTLDFSLVPLEYDTITVTGVVVDDESGEGVGDALLIVAYNVWSGFEIRAYSDSGTADGEGAVEVLLETANAVSRINWSVEAAGYQSEEGQSPVSPDNTVDLDTVRLSAYTEQDSVDYSISGRVLDENDEGVGGIEVVVTMERGEDVLFVDTVTTVDFGINFSTGAYRAQTRQEYGEGEITVSVSADIDGYESANESVTVPSSTSDITIDLHPVPLGTAVVTHKAARVRDAVDGEVRVYSIQGRLLGSIVTAGSVARISEITQVFGRQPLIVEWRAAGMLVKRERFMPMR